MRRLFTATFAAFVLCYLLAAGIGLAAQATKPARESRGRQESRRVDAGVDCRWSKPTSRGIAASATAKMRRATDRRRPKDTHPPNLTDAKWDHGSTDGEIFAVIKDGIGPKFDMKGYNSKMTPQEMWNVVNYLRSIGPAGPLGKPRSVMGRAPRPLMLLVAFAGWTLLLTVGSDARAGRRRSAAARRRSTRRPTTTFGVAVNDFFGIRPAAEAAVPVPAQDARREEDHVHRLLPRERDEGADRRSAEHQDVHDLPRVDRDRPPADSSKSPTIEARHRPVVAARLRLRARGACPVQPRAAHPRQGRVLDVPRRHRRSRPSPSGTSI